MTIKICSIWMLRPEEHPEAAARNYPGMLRILQHSCDRLGLDHIVLTDFATASSPLWPKGIESFPLDLPVPLMRACTEAHAKYLETRPETDTMFVGADCLFLADPHNFYPTEPDMCVTYRTAKDKHPINAGAQLIRQRAIDKIAPLYRRIADRCGKIWCDDQRALCAELSPLPPANGIYERAGAKVAFLPMKKFNHLPVTIDDACRGACMLHFRGKNRKKFLFDWAARQGFVL